MINCPTCVSSTHGLIHNQKDFLRKCGNSILRFCLIFAETFFYLHLQRQSNLSTFAHHYNHLFKMQTRRRTREVQHFYLDAKRKSNGVVSETQDLKSSKVNRFFVTQKKNSNKTIILAVGKPSTSHFGKNLPICSW